MHSFKLKHCHLGFIGLLLLFTATCAPTEPIVEQPQAVSPEEEVDRTFTYAVEPESVDYPNPLLVLYNEGYVSGYDEIRGNPAWVAYRVFTVDEYHTFDRPSRFLIDDRTENRISHDVYTNSGYDRGHMAPNFAIVMIFAKKLYL